MVSIAIIDKIGLCYDGDTLSKSGLGGSESAVILMANELSKIGFDVTVFNNCNDSSHSKSGIFNKVKYIDNSDAYNYTGNFDIVIVSRTVEPFYNKTLYPFIVNSSIRILWMHDTFCWGDNLIEELVLSGDIHWIFTLSDFHTSYILNCDHGKRRNYEVLKRHVFQTRNGAVCHIPEVDLSKKDINHFVYNASVTKGLLPLLENIWPSVKSNIPDAKLTVIGGYYRFRENSEPDIQEKQLKQLISSHEFNKLSVTFTDVIPQYQIAEILANAGFMIYPGIFPETFGISSLESLLYNTPIITTRFGALEETAIENACYLLDYAIEPNSLFTDINKEQQCNKFIELVLHAYSNRYLYQQKQNYCSIIQDISGWDTIALQWKQFFYKILGKFLSVDEYRKVKRINEKVARVFGRVNHMPFINQYSSSGNQLPIKIISTLKNSQAYIDKCILSVVQQDYDNYQHIIIDDKSTDNSLNKIWEIINSLPEYIQDKITVITNTESVGALCNQVSAIRSLNDDDIIMILDGDDWLVNNNSIFHYYNDLYQTGIEFTYGSCWSLADNIPLIAQDYPLNIKNNKKYRSHLFNWNIPYTHLRTFKKYLINDISDDSFKDNDVWYKAGGDAALFYELIERVNPNNIKANKEIMYNYNDLNPLNDYKINSIEQNKNSEKIINQSKKNELFSVVIPTMWRATDIFLQSLTSLINEDLVGEIIIINNDNKKTPTIDILNHDKIVILDFDKNIFVNPAWNIGVKTSKYDNICLLNDDLLFDTTLFKKILPYMNCNSGVIGLNPGLEQFNQPIIDNDDISIDEWNQTHTFGFGCLMFIYKPNWIVIPNELKIYYGDNFIFDNALRQNKSNYIISNLKFETLYAQTTADKSITEGMLDKEHEIYNKLMNQSSINSESNNISGSKILIAIPHKKYIEPTTMESIWFLKNANTDCEIDFQYFYGYTRTQIKNLIASWYTFYDYIVLLKRNVVFSKNILDNLGDYDIIYYDNFDIVIFKTRVFSEILSYPYFEEDISETLEFNKLLDRSFKNHASIKQGKL